MFLLLLLILSYFLLQVYKYIKILFNYLNNYGDVRLGFTFQYIINYLNINIIIRQSIVICEKTFCKHFMGIYLDNYVYYHILLRKCYIN